MALPFSLSEDALLDLEQALAHIAQDSTRAANRLADELEQTFLFLAQWPSAGHTRDDLSPDQDLKFWPMKNYLIGYYGNLSPIVIVGVLHGSRDATSIFSTRLGRS